MRETFNTLDDYPEVMTTKMISKYLGLGYLKTLDFIKYSGVDYIKVNNSYMVKKSSLKTWLDTPGQRTVALRPAINY